MSKYRLTIRVSGAPAREGKVELADFARVCEALAKSLKSVEQAVAGRTGKTEFEIRNLKTGSAVLVLDAVRRSGTDNRGQVVSAFRRVIDDLNEGKISPDLAGIDIDPFREIAHLLHNGVEAIRIGRVKLTAEFAAKLERVTVKGVSSHGSVTGVLDRVNVHDRNELSLYPPGSTRQVACRFPDALLESVREGLKRTVTVSGEMQYEAGEPYPKRCNVTKIEVHPPVSDLPTLYDVRELGKWGTDGLSAVEFVRAIRDE